MADINTFFVAKTNQGFEQLVGGLVIFVYLAYTTMVLAHRLGVKRSWLAWIPIANLYLMTKMAALPWWWMLGFFIPFINFLVAGYIWSEIGKRFNKPWWLGALTAIPLIGLLVPGYLVITSGGKLPPKIVEPVQS